MEIGDCAIEGYVGDQIKDIVMKNSIAFIEMTFHLDHLFGDLQLPLNNHVNKQSIGFDPLSVYLLNDKIEIDQAELQRDFPPELYQKFISSIHTLGHNGEGHCEVLTASTHP